MDKAAMKSRTEDLATSPNTVQKILSFIYQRRYDPTRGSLPSGILRSNSGPAELPCAKPLPPLKRCG